MIGLILLTVFWAGVQTDIPAAHPILPETLLQGALLQDEEDEGKKEKEEEKPLPIPDLSAVDREKAKRFVNFLKNSNPDKRRDYEKKLVALGRGALPHLLEKAETDHKHQSLGVQNCLVLLLDVKDRKVLGEFAKSKTVRLRRLAAGKYAEAARPKDKEILKGFLKDEERSIRLEAALGLAQLGDATGIGEIILSVAQSKAKERARILDGLGKLKSKVYSSHFKPYAVRHEDPEVRKAAIEVIVAIGDLRVKDVLGQALSDDHNLVKTAAVNALRKLIKGEEPTAFPTVFDLVNAVEKWKKELGLIR